jgi:hypothetical protein
MSSATATQNYLDHKPLPWETGSPSLWSLWTLLKTYAWPLVNHIENLTEIRQDLQSRLYALTNVGYAPAEISDNDRNSFNVVLGALAPWLEGHSLTASHDVIKRIQEEVDQEDPSLQTLIASLQFFNTVLEDELRRQTFLYITPQDAKLFNHPADGFTQTLASYPSVRNDIYEACHCHALGCYTACVYHTMAIAQHGLHALANHLGVSFPYSLDLAEWSAVISRIEDKIKPMREGPRTDHKDAQLSFYSECAAQFRYFKDAWRNHVGHMREIYDENQSLSILIHTREFMEKLSTRLTELPKP